MQMDFIELDHGIRLIKLTGRLDILGVGQIETSFAGYCSGEKPLVLVDLSGVDFLASIGIRLFILNAKAVANRGGKMVLLNPAPDVYNVLEVSGIPSIIPLYSSFESAEAVLLSANSK